ncbi:protein Shroom isoform X3 [Scaptodrosophila lebanonensis]|uniref:Protein Shroom isoform X3 n=1 Tax=Drosophila lebanonensis TaxID=7225 RepID=A0A6J2UI94_DROLE|nr:protein Shroom isoform X3 [Scaptodrosophila lebanonensis]
MAHWFPWFRSNSKASYLPRQSLEKLNNTDPDHGIYKLTLTSNEDLVAHNKPSYELLPSVGGGGKLPNNLPDVLPLGVKLQQQPKPLPGQAGSPNGLVNEVPLRYGSNNNLATNSPTNATPYTMIYTTAAASASQHQRYSSPALSDYKRKTPFGHLQHYTRSQSYDLNQSAGIPNNNPTQFMSQSHVDLKQTAYDLETTLEEVLPVVSETPPRLSPAHSDCSLSSGGGGGGSSLDSSPASVEPHIFRAELISTTLSTPPKPTMNRQESLRENIEKITQLQSKLMSAHLCDSGILGGSYTSAKQANPTPLQPSTVEHMEKCLKDESAVSPGEFCEGAEPSNNKNEELSPPVTPLLQMDASTDGLKLVQRSEIVLRVNPPSTCEIACQTDELPDFDLGRLSLHNNVRDEQQTRTTLQPRQRQTIEVDYDNLANELLQLLAPNDKLIEILTPKIYKPTTEYVSNLYNPNVPLRPTKRDVGTSTLMRMKTSTTSPTTAMSESKLITVELQLTDLDSVLLNGACDPECTNLIKQKLDELIKQLNQKIAALKREKQTISEECGVNEKVGTDLLAKLTEKVRPSEASKFRTYIDDVGHITSLLLSLSERLAQTECNLESRAASGYSSEQEKITLEAKRDLLYEQLEEAKRLKADIDRRGSSIATLFGKHLSADECADYDYFINMKAKLIADARDLADKIKCSEEQLGALRDALVQSDC